MIAAARPASSGGDRSRGERRAAAVVLLAGVLVQSWLVLSVAYPPIQDYPNHLLRLHVQERLGSVPVYADNLSLDPGFRPNLLTDWYLAFLARLLPLRVAGKVLLVSLIALGGAAAWIYLARFGGGATGAWVAVSLMGGWFFLKGNLNFNAAVGLALLYLAAAFWPGGRVTIGGWMLAVFLSLAVLSAHAFVFLAAGGMAAAAALLAPGRALGERLARAATVVPGCAILATFLWRQAAAGTLGDNRLVYSAGLHDLVFEYPLTLWDHLRPLFRHAHLSLEVVVAALVCASLAAAYARRLLGRDRGSWSGDAAVLTLLVSAGAVLYVALPNQLSGGWGHMKYRMADLLVLASMPLLGALRPRTLRPILSLLLAGASILFAFEAQRDYGEFDRQAAEFVSLGRDLPPGSLILALDLMPRDEPIRPFLHLWSYVCIEHDCLAPALFATRYVQNIYFRRTMPAPPEGVPDAEEWKEVARLAVDGPYRAVLLRGRSAAGEAALGGSMTLEAQNGSGSLYLRPAGAGLAAPEGTPGGRRP